jgi:hypothetical protein
MCACASNCYVLPVVLSGGKTHKGGKVGDSGTVRHCIPELCAQHALALMHSYTLGATPFPAFRPVCTLAPAVICYRRGGSSCAALSSFTAVKRGLRLSACVPLVKLLLHLNYIISLHAMLRFVLQGPGGVADGCAVSRQQRQDANINNETQAEALQQVPGHLDFVFSRFRRTSSGLVALGTWTRRALTTR